MRKLIFKAFYSYLFYALLTTFFIACGVSKEWVPSKNEALYKEAIKKVNSIEPFSRFLEIERATIKQPNPEYYKERWAYIKDVYYDNPNVSTPKIVLTKFIAFCSENNLLETNKSQFSKAAEILGFELITDGIPFKTPSGTYTEHLNIPYITQNDYSQNLDLFIPNTPTIKPVPCIIFIHGGGWKVHKRGWFEAFARYIADKGYAAATIDYRMLHAVDSPIACVNDAKAAVRWIRANAEKYGIDPNKIGASGASAGGQLAAILATSGNNNLLNGTIGNINVSSKIQAAVGFATPTMTGTRMTWPWKKGKKPSWYDKISPYLHVTKDDAPMKFIHGTADKTVNVNEAKDMHAKYIELGIQTELELIQEKGHVFYMNTKSAESAFKFFRTIFEH